MATKKNKPTHLQSDLQDEKHRAKVAEMAYRIAESRGFTPGQELDDWLQAESLCAEDAEHMQA